MQSNIIDSDEPIPIQTDYTWTTPTGFVCWLGTVLFFVDFLIFRGGYLSLPKSQVIYNEPLTPVYTIPLNNVGIPAFFRFDFNQ